MSTTTKTVIGSLAVLVTGLILVLAGEQKIGIPLLTLAGGVLVGQQFPSPAEDKQRRAGGLFLLCAVPAFLASSCGTLDAQYVEADRATYDSIAPWAEEKADPTDERDQRKLQTIESWRLRLEEAERTTGDSE